MDTATPDPLALLKTRKYVALLVIAALIGVPVSLAAYFFLAFVTKLQVWSYNEVPESMGLGAEPSWWPVPLLLLSGLLTALCIRRLPGRGGHSPAEGLHMGGGPPRPVELPGILAAALASLALGAVIGPEAPLIALAGGLAVLPVYWTKREEPEQTVAVLGACGSFAAVSTLLGSPLVGAFMMMEAVGLGGARATLVLMPGLLAAGVGFMVFIGLDSWTGLGTFSLTLPALPSLVSPSLTEFAWAFVFGASTAVLGTSLRKGALGLKPQVERRIYLMTPGMGLVVAAMAIVYTQTTGHSYSDVLFSGQDAIGPVVENRDSYSTGALLLLLACKALGYCVSLSAFRGGPIFPAVLIGATGGLLCSEVAGLPATAGVAMGIAGMTATMLRLPLTAAMLASLLVASSGTGTIPLVIVTVVVAYMVTAWLSPVPSVAVADDQPSVSPETAAPAAPEEGRQAA